LVAVIAALSAAAGGLTPKLTNAARAASPAVGTGELVALTLTFKVQNVNRSKVPCPSDGAAYTVRGHLVAQTAMLRQPHRAVTLYLHGFALTEQPTWRQGAVGGYDYASEEARLGHASVVIDQLGYGSSDVPDGYQVCNGSQADVAHQVVQKLRNGEYAANSRAGITFERVALAGESWGGLVAPIEAYSFGDVEALLPIGAGFDQALTSPDILTGEGILGPASRGAPVCTRGGEPKRAGASAGYAYFFKPLRADKFFFDAEPTIVDRTVSGVERDPCGLGNSLVTTLAVNRIKLGRVAVPVLLVFGAEDRLFPPSASKRQRNLYTGSGDVTLSTLPRSGHFPMLEKIAPEFRTQVSDWLRARGF
jgi:pimeloyl-ACP methyl ester carboxylesterase